MNPLRLSKLEKLKIFAYTKPDRLVEGEKFEVMFNPETYSLSYTNEFSDLQGINTSGRTANYSKSEPGQLSLTLLLDGTGVDVFGLTVLGKYTHVSAQVKEFLRLTYRMDGDIHEPKFLTIRWGELTFKCRLKSVEVKYTLFDHAGIPLRAELQTVFFSDVGETERLKDENKNSPDLTHSRIVGAHDLLPLMCEKIYGSAKYYIHVARANNLKDFRDLKPGQEIFFPPIEK